MCYHVRAFCITILFFLLFANTETAKILCVFQVPFLSHQIQFRTLTEELLRRHHEIDVITADPTYPENKTPPNLTEINVHSVSYIDSFRKMLENDEDGTIISQMNIASDILIDVIINQFASKKIQDLIKSEKFYDLIIADAGFTSTVVLTHYFKTPLITLGTTGATQTISDFMGIPRHPLYYSNFLTNSHNDLSLYKKYEIIYNDVRLYNIMYFENKIQEVLRREFFPGLPTFSELYNNVHIYLVNMYPIWEGIRPYPPNSGLFKFKSQTNQYVPKEFQSYLDSSKNGVIYASLGTRISFSKLPEQTIITILGAFSKLPFEILLKCDTNELPGRPINVKLFKFLPQPNILRHPKVKLFITHGGQHSLDEAIEAAVPILVIPHQFDQFANAERCVYHDIGNQLDLKSISEAKLLDAIHNVIENKRYRDNIFKLRSLLQDQPLKTMDRLVWAIEYTIRHGGAKHMRSPSANLTCAEFYEFELLTYFLSMCLIMLIVVIKIILTVKKLIIKMSRAHNFSRKIK